MPNNENKHRLTNKEVRKMNGSINRGKEFKNENNDDFRYKTRNYQVKSYY